MLKATARTQALTRAHTNVRPHALLISFLPENLCRGVKGDHGAKSRAGVGRVGVDCGRPGLHRASRHPGLHWCHLLQHTQTQTTDTSTSATGVTFCSTHKHKPLTLLLQPLVSPSAVHTNTDTSTSATGVTFCSIHKHKPLTLLLQPLVSPSAAHTNTNH